MSKHRTQVSLETWQYESLESRAKRQQRSLSALVREAVSEYLERPAAPADRSRGLDRIRGVVSDPEASGRDHDRVL